MSVYRNPPLLFRKCLIQCVLQIQTACKHIIELSDGEFDSPKCQMLVQELGNFLFLNIPPCILNKMLQERHCTKELSFSEPRVFLSLLLNSTTKTFGTDSRLDTTIPVDFWIDTIPTLTNLLSLDLSQVCTDEILYVVGKNCIRLNHINVISAYRKMPSNFNAITLSHSVTDKGLQYLFNCKQLKKIELDEPRCGRCKIPCITLDGIKNIMLNLTRLEEISYTDVGSLISQDYFQKSKLQLRKVQHYNSTKASLKSIEKACPYIEQLVLVQFKSDSTDANETIIFLTKSSMKLKCVDLRHFGFNRIIEKYFSVKGVYLIKLVLIAQYEEAINTSSVVTIAKSCPNLVHLHLEKISENPNVAYDEELQYVGLFDHLQILILTGRTWNYTFIIPMCLLKAYKIQEITCIDMNDSVKYPLDELLQRICKINRNLSQISVLQLFKPFEISYTFLISVIKHFVNLKVCQVWCDHSQLLTDELKTLNFPIHDYDVTYNDKSEKMTIM